MNFDIATVEINCDYEFAISVNFKTLHTKPTQFRLNICDRCKNTLNWDVKGCELNGFLCYKINTDESLNDCIKGCPFDNPCGCRT